MQVTADQLETWNNDVNAYIAHEDEGSFECSIRISAADVVSEICDSFGGEGWQVSLHACGIAHSRHARVAPMSRFNLPRVWLVCGRTQQPLHHVRTAPRFADELRRHFAASHVCQRTRFCTVCAPLTPW